MQPCAAGAGFCLRTPPHGPSLERVAALKKAARPPKLAGAGPSRSARRTGSALAFMGLPAAASWWQRNRRAGPRGALAAAAPAVSSVKHMEDGAAQDLEKLWEELSVNGVCIIKDVFTPEQITKMKEAHQQVFVDVLEQIRCKAPEQRTYSHYFKGEASINKIDCWDLSDGSEMLQLGERRYDYNYGMDRGCFLEPFFRQPPVLSELMQRGLKSGYSMYAGALPSCSRSGFGFWHRDTFPLFSSSYDDVDVSLPPFYYTVLIPLVPLTLENGATEIITGSHRTSDSAANLEDEGRSLRAICEPGTVVVFDGRCYHRGMPNSTDEERTVLYMVWHKIWYNDLGTTESEFPQGVMGTPHAARPVASPSRPSRHT